MNKEVKSLLITIIIALILFCVLALTGCNKQIIDLDYTYDIAICEIGDEIKEIKIDTWNDYEGEQIQIKDKEGKVYLLSSFNCTLVRD